jgi:hypothetical protein
MTYSIDRSVKNTIQMRPNSISPESGKNIACVGQTTNKFEQKEVRIGPTQKCLKKHEVQFGLLVL